MQALSLAEGTMAESRSRTRIATGLPGIDAALGGPFEPGIVEVIGRSGVGKSQFAMTVAAQFISDSARSGRAPQGVVFIDTEGKFPPRRCVEIATSAAADDSSRKAIAAAMATHMTFLRANDSSELRRIVENLESTMSRVQARLVVVDSIAALARRDFDGSGLRARQAQLSDIAAKLKQLADAYNAVVLVTNQVSGVLADDEGGALPSGMVRPALGNTWSHCVNTRLVLEMTTLEVDTATGHDEDDEDAGEERAEAAATRRGSEPHPASSSSFRYDGVSSRSAQPGVAHALDPAKAVRLAAQQAGIRSITIAKSPVAPHAVDHFVVCAAGVRPLPSGDRLRQASRAAASSASGALAGTSVFDASVAAAGFASEVGDDALMTRSEGISAAVAAQDGRNRGGGAGPPELEEEEEEDVFAGLTEAELAALADTCT
jgi:RecA/RadA recombinase